MLVVKILVKVQNTFAPVLKTTCQPLKPLLEPVVAAFVVHSRAPSVQPEESASSVITTVPGTTTNVAVPVPLVVAIDVLALTVPLKVKPKAPFPPCVFLMIVSDALPGGGNGGVLVPGGHSIEKVGIGQPDPASSSHFTYGPICDRGTFAPERFVEGAIFGGVLLPGSGTTT